jgi:hypothetical protein
MPTETTNTPTNVVADTTKLSIKVLVDQPGQADRQLNDKGARDYIQAARILSDHGGLTGPTLFCRGQAVEIALKFFLRRRDAYVPKSFKQGGHKHHQLNELYAACTTTLKEPLALAPDQVLVINDLHLHHYEDGDLEFPDRFRSDKLRPVTTYGGQGHVEALVETIVAQAKREQP